MDEETRLLVQLFEEEDEGEQLDSSLFSKVSEPRELQELLDRQGSEQARHLVRTLRSHRKRTLVHAAVERDSAEVIRLLVGKYDADVEAVDAYGYTPVMLACAEVSPSSLSALIEMGADYKRRVKNRSALVFAAMYGNEPTTLQILLEAGGLDVNEQFGYTQVTALIAACRFGRVHHARFLLKAGAIVFDNPSHPELSALQHAVESKNTELVQILLQHTIKSGEHFHEGVTRCLRDRKEPQYRTLLQRACDWNDPLMVRALLAAGANPNRYASHHGPLYRAALKGHCEVVRILLDSGANFETEQHHDRRTPLHAASQAGSATTVELLLRAGANATKVDKSRLKATPLKLAVRRQSIGAVSKLISSGQVAKEIEEGIILTDACELGLIDIVKCLLISGVNLRSVEAKDLGCRALQCTIKSGASEDIRLSIVKLLVESGASVNATHGLESPLMVAAYTASMGIVTFLVEAGADLDFRLANASAQLPSGSTVLCAAALGACKEILAYLIESKKNLRTAATNPASPSLLHLALLSPRNPSVDCVRYLMSLGEDVDAKTDRGQTPLSLAIEAHRPDLVKVLVETGNADVNLHGFFTKYNTVMPLLHGVCEQAHFSCKTESVLVEIMNILIDAGALVTTRSSSETTALHVAAILCSFPLVERLLSCGQIEVNALDHNGNPPLYLTIAQGHWTKFLEVSQALLDSGADVNIVTKAGHTALSLELGGRYLRRNDTRLLRLILDKTKPDLMLNGTLATGPRFAPGLGTKTHALVFACAALDTPFIEAVAEVSDLAVYGYEALTQAFYFDNPAGIHYLLAHGVKLDVSNRRHAGSVVSWLHDGPYQNDRYTRMGWHLVASLIDEDAAAKCEAIDGVCARVSFLAWKGVVFPQDCGFTSHLDWRTGVQVKRYLGRAGERVALVALLCRRRGQASSSLPRDLVKMLHSTLYDAHLYSFFE